MATCKDCIHHDLCDAKGHLILTINDICELEYRSDVSEWWCKNYKPTADVAPKSEEEGAECPTCHGTGRIGTTDWLTKGLSKKQIAEEKAKAVAEHEQHIKTEVIKEFAERLKKYYSHLDGKSPTPLIVYHIDQIEKEMLEEKI